MANFTTHIAIGTVVSGALATLTLAADVVAPENLVAVTLAGVLGSVLPDIDLKESRPSRAMFAGLAIFFSFAVLFNAATKFSIAELWILWLGTLVVVRYGLHTLFHRVSVHRGIWHSILAAVFSAVATAIVFNRVLGQARRRRMARRRVHVRRLHHTPYARRDLLGRRHGHADQVIVRDGAEAL